MISILNFLFATKLFENTICNSLKLESLELYSSYYFSFAESEAHCCKVCMRCLQF